MCALSDTPRKRVPRAQREKQLLDAAAHSFMEHGFLATTMSDVAGNVGVTKPLIYDYFGSKEGLLEAVIGRVNEAMIKQTNAAWTESAGKPIRERVRLTLVSFFQFTQTHGREFNLWGREVVHLQPTGNGSSKRPAEAMERTRLRISADIIDEISALPQTAAVDPYLLNGFAALAIGACERVAVWCSQDQRITPEMAAGIVDTLLWDGIGLIFAPKAAS